MLMYVARVLFGLMVALAGFAIGEFVFGFKMPSFFSWQFVGFMTVVFALDLSYSVAWGKR